jgi:O-antigen/teichoic acid export membrane protein
LASWVLSLSSRFFLARYADLHEVGIYTTGTNIVGIVTTLMACFNTAYSPYVFSIAKQTEAKTVYTRMMTYALTLFTLVSLGLSLFAPQALRLLVSPAYYGAASVVPLIALAYLFYELDYILSFGLNLANKTVYCPFIMGSVAVFSLILNFFLIQRFAMMGAAISSVLSYGLLCIIEYVVVRRVYPISYEWLRLLKLALVSTGTYLVGITFRTSLFWNDLGIGALLILTWFLVLYWWRFFTPNEFSATRNAINTCVCAAQVHLRLVVSKMLVFIRPE